MVAQRTTSSASREMSTAVIAATKANSATKSREAVPSIEFSTEAAEARGRRPPPRGRARARSRRARRSRRATPPRGRPSRAAARRRAAAARRGRAGGGRAAPAGRAAGACGPASARRGAGRPGRRGRRRRRAPARRPSRAWSRRYIRNSVAIWSLRDRPARSRPPTSAPARSISPRSSAVCTSSSSVAGPEGAGRDVGGQLVQPRQHRGEVGVVEQARPRAAPGRARASPAMSYCASRQSKWVDLLRAASASAGPPAKRPPHRLSRRRACAGDGSRSGLRRSAVIGWSVAVRRPSRSVATFAAGGCAGGDDHDRVVARRWCRAPRPGPRGRWPRRGSWRRPAGCAARRGCAEGSAVTSSSSHTRRRRASRSPAVGRRAGGAVAALAGHGIHEGAPRADLDGAELDEVARQRGLGDLDAVVGEQVEQLGLRAHLGARRGSRRSAAGGPSWWRRSLIGSGPRLLLEQEGQQGLLGVQAVLGLVPDHRLRAVDDRRPRPRSRGRPAGSAGRSRPASASAMSDSRRPRTARTGSPRPGGRPSRLHAHRDPGVGGDDVDARRRPSAGSSVTSDRAALCSPRAPRPGPDRRGRLVAGRGADRARACPASAPPSR